MIIQGLWTSRISKFQTFANIKKTIFIFKFKVSLNIEDELCKKDQNLNFYSDAYFH